MARTAATVAEAHGAASSPASAALPRRAPGLGDMMNALPSPPLSPAPLEPPFSAAPPGSSSAFDDGFEPPVDTDAGREHAGERGGAQDAAAAVETEANDVDDKYAAESFPDRFPSWEALDAYVQEFKEHSYQMFGVRTSVPVKRRNERIAQRHSTHSAYQKLPESWQFYSRIYGCTHGVRPRNRGKGLRVHGSVRDTGCTARMNATLKVDRATKLYYISVRLDGFHNHPCDKERYYGYPENRRIKDPALLRKLLQMHERGLSFGEIQRRLARLIVETRGEGGVPTRADLHNTISRLKNAKQEAPGIATEQQTPAIGEGDDDEPHDEHGHEDVADDGVDPPSTMFTGAESHSRKRKADQLTTFDGDLEAFARKTFVPVKLDQLDTLLGTPYSYQHIRKELEDVAIARVQTLPRTISGFVHEVVPLSLSESSENVDFLLPQYAIHGCENGIVTYCRYHGVHPSSLGVRLPVVRQFSSGASTLATVSSHQLRVMKQIHLARQNVRDTNSMIEWLHTAAQLQGDDFALPVCFADYARWNKDRFLSALKLTPLTKTVIRGTTSSGGHEFTDTIVGARVLRFCSNTNLDVDCMKAILLHLHARFYADASFVCPSYLLETDDRERSRKASSYGAFTAQKETVMGVAQVQSSHWGSFVLNWPKRQCFVYAPDETAFHELKQSLTGLFRPFVINVVFMYAPCPEADTARATDASASGVLALLFLECVLVRSTWADIPLSALDYYRLRYLMLASEVVGKQDLHEIQWFEV